MSDSFHFYKDRHIFVITDSRKETVDCLGEAVKIGLALVGPLEIAVQVENEDFGRN